MRDLFDDSPPRGVELGKLDEVHTIIGERGTGKSVHGMRITHKLQGDFDGYVVGHSPGARIDERDPDGFSYDISWHDTMRGLERGLQRNPERKHILANPDIPPEAVIAYGRALSESLKRGAIEDAGLRFRRNRPPPPGVKAPPVIILVDEGVAMADKGDKLSKRDLELLLTGARHENIAIVWGIQSPTMRTWTLIEQSSSIHVFRYEHEYGRNALRAAGVPDWDTLQELERFQFITHDKVRKG